MARITSRRRLAAGGAVLAAVCGTLTVATVAAPSAFAVSCNGSGTSSNLIKGTNGYVPNGTIFTVPSAGQCLPNNVYLTGAKPGESYRGILLDPTTDTWISCNANFTEWTAGHKPLELCSSVKSGIEFAIVQETGTSAISVNDMSG
jgi:hypothetical protein